MYPKIFLIRNSCLQENAKIKVYALQDSLGVVQVILRKCLLVTLMHDCNSGPCLLGRSLVTGKRLNLFLLTIYVFPQSAPIQLSMYASSHLSYKA